MNYLPHICQFKNLKSFKFIFVAFLLFFSCSTEQKAVKRVAPELSWFKTGKKFRFDDQNGDPVNHLFFDYNPNIDLDKRELDVQLLSPQGGQARYEIDMVSGKRFMERKYCEFEDKWKRYNAKLSGQPFSMAFVPRLLDQVRLPQRVVVFGSHLVKENLAQDNTLRVRVIGGSIEQFCDVYPCKLESSWQSRLLLFAVNLSDPEYGKLKKMSELAKVTDWLEVKAFLENNKGVNVVGGKEIPAYRLIGNIFADKALSYAVEKGHLFTVKEMKTLRVTCEALYDKIYSKLNNTTTKGFKFSKTFEEIYTQDWSAYNTCQQFVRSSNVTIDKDRNWFFAYLDAFLLVERLGYAYSCRNGSWIKTERKRKFSKMELPTFSFKNCPDKLMNLAFERAVNLLTGISSSERVHYAFKEYDHGAWGSHEKIYSWLKVNGKKLSCQKEVEKDIFPQDVSWKYIKSDKKVRVEVVR